MGKAKKLKVSKQNTVTTGVYCFRKLAMLENNSHSLSVGPLGDQIVRGEMAAPTGRSKDRTRMDEDEVSSSRLNFCNGASMILVVFQYLLK